MRIVIVEDQQLLREIVRKLCTVEFGHEVVGEAGEGEEAIRVICATQPDLVLLDLGLPGTDGFAVQETVKKAAPAVRFIAFTSAQGTYPLYRVERAAFEGFVDKAGQSLDGLREAIEAVGRGQRYLPPSFLAAKAARRQDPVSFDKLLSPREVEVLALVGFGLSDIEIGSRLGIAPKTAETFRHRLLTKLNLKGTPKLMRFAIEHGFTQTSPAPRP